jgi:hypothetical protein
MAERIGVYKVSWGNLRERDRLENPDIDERIITDRSSGSEMRWYGLNRAGSGYEQVSGICGSGSKLSSFSKYGDILNE